MALKSPDSFPEYSEDWTFEFPGTDEARSDGLLCVGGNLSAGMLLSAYEQAVFPWYNSDDPILWWSPDPRFVLFPDNLYISSRNKRYLKQTEYTFSMNTAFRDVISNCAAASRQGEDGTWINDQMIEAYSNLNDLGFAHSFECWKHDELVGGFYGINIGTIFCGESMFNVAANASKLTFLKAVPFLVSQGVTLIDSQLHTENIERYGAEHISRDAYLKLIKNQHRFNGVLYGLKDLKL